MATTNRVLVVDDDIAVRTLLRDAAQEIGYQTAGAGNRREFLAALPTFDPTLVVLDLTIPGTDGVELMRDLEVAAPHARVILVSGQDERLLSGVERLGRMRGISILGALTKPVRLSDLWGLLQEARGTLASELESALRNDEFELFFQPKIGLQGTSFRAVVGSEALLRWRHPTRGVVGPEEIIPVAEESGLIAPITEFVVRSVARHMTAWRGCGTDVPTAINFSPKLMSDLTWPDRIGAILDEEGASTSSVIVEITESAAMADPRKSLEIATRLRLRDISLSLDDFGSGFSSVVELYRLPLQELKLDRSLVADIERDPGARTVTSALVALGRELGLSICAEGVESVAAEHALRGMGCHAGQGYLYSKPLPASAYEAFVATQRSVA